MLFVGGIAVVGNLIIRSYYALIVTVPFFLIGLYLVLNDNESKEVDKSKSFGEADEISNKDVR